MELDGARVLVVGGGSGIGFGVAQAAAAKGARVTLASRNLVKLESAAARIGPGTGVAVLDVVDPDQVKAFFDRSAHFDHIVTTTSSLEARQAGVMAPVQDLPLAAARAMMEAKYWGQVHVAKYGAAKLAPTGSITLTAGIASKKYVPAHGGLAPVNAAVGAFAWLFAYEIGPKRCNAVSPGLVRTEAYDHLGLEAREAFFNRYAQEFLPVKHVAAVEEVAKTYIYLMESDYHTGDVICVDGGLWRAT
ncbi:MAG: SDR family oxidoreductase [Thermodesulfobacteriota bacterium]